MRNPWIVIVGPTAVGKSDLSHELGLRFNGEIVSCDSKLFYCGMDIGTAKPKESKIPLHMIDCANPSQSFDASLYRKKALSIISDLHRRKKNVFIVGGSGFYVRALLEGIYDSPPRDSRFRKSCEKKDLKILYEELCSIDAKSAETIHRNDRFRIVRALEVFHQSGRKLSDIKNEFYSPNLPVIEEPVFLKIGLNMPKEDLHRRIEERVNKMLCEGWEEEVKRLLVKYEANDIASKGIGYKEVIAYLHGQLSREELRERIVCETKKLAKKQNTWFKRDKTIRWYHPQVDKEKIYWIINKSLENGSMLAV